MNKLIGSFLAACCAFLSAAPAHAGTLADVSVINRSTGQRLPIYSHGGKLYVAGQPGERYAVQVANRSARRILSVVSVDGVNVISGETAAADQTGYVLAPWQSYEISGWRKNADEVAAFYFTSLPDSYAARTDRPNHVGVIGVAVFREWIPPRPRPQPRPFDGALSRSQENARADRPAAAEAPAESATGSGVDADQARSEDRAAPAAPAIRRQIDKLGTGHGERESSSVTYTDFRRATPQPNEVLTLYYDRYENLVARGIITVPHRAADPQPFPAGMRFVPDPRG